METTYISKDGSNRLDYTKEQIKLTRNSKGYTWEIKIVSDEEHLTDADLARLESLKDKMGEQYGREED